MIDNQKLHIIRIFVFGTLCKGARLSYYMGGSTFKGRYYGRGQLMMAENGSVYIDTDDHQAHTFGEVHLVDYDCLQRINHLESKSGEFPKGYDLAMIPVWNVDKFQDYKYNPDEAELCFYYRRRNNPVKIMGGDYVSYRDPILELGDFLRAEKSREYTEEEVMSYMKKIISKIDF